MLGTMLYMKKQTIMLTHGLDGVTAFAANSYNFSHFTLRWKGRFLTENFFYRCRLKFTNLPTANFFAVFSVNG